MAKKINSPGGSGAGNKGKAVIQDPERPECHRCGGFMRSNKDEWRCTDTDCGASVLKIKKDASIRAYNESLGFDPEPAERHAQKCKKKKRLIVTSAQNNSPVFLKAFKALLHACQYFNAELAVIPVHYFNKSLWTKGDVKEYDKVLKPYLVKGSFEFGNVVIHSDVRISPTAVNPLSGFHSHDGRKWSLYGHPQVCREPVAVAEGFPKLMLTTGSITEPSFSVSKAGNSGAWHHSYSAILLEICDEEFTFNRHLSFNDNGSFYDFGTKFTPRGITHGHRCRALNTGDDHAIWNTVEKETFGTRGLCEAIRPEFIVRNDVLDGYAGSHHHEKQPLTQYLKYHRQQNDYRKELDATIDFINRTTPDYATTLIVPSNHHDHLMQWLNRVNANNDPVNADLILELQLAVRLAAKKGEIYDPFYLYAKDKLTCKFEFLDRNRPYYIDDINHAQHGDVGTNGSRGSARGLAKVPDKLTIGHSHGARIFQGVYQAGVSTGKLEYERGYSDHSNSHVIQYQDGKRAIIDIYKGQFRAKHRVYNKKKTTSV